MDDLCRLTAAELADSYRSRSTNPRAVVESILSRIEDVDGRIDAFTAVDAEQALAAADNAATLLDNGKASRLCGIPIAVKEAFAVRGMPWTAQSLTREGIVAQGDAAVVGRLRETGAIILGTTRTHELAWGITTQHETLGGTKNPWNTGFTPGGSSGGSAAAVAAGMTPIALGSDTACSIRLPAAFCGIAGFKPSRNMVDTEGLLPLALRFDDVGWLARSVGDLRTVLELMSSVESCRTDLASTPSEVRIGVADVIDLTPFGREQREGLRHILERAKEAGATVKSVDWPRVSEVLEVFRDLQSVDALNTHRSIHKTWPEQAELYGSDLRSHLEYAESVTPAAVRIAEERLTFLAQRWSTALSEVDVVILPTAASGPSRIDDPNWTLIDDERVALRDGVIGLNASANIAGAPACSIPVGMDQDGIPVGVQIIGAPDSDLAVLAIAEMLATLVADRLPKWPSLSG